MRALDLMRSQTPSLSRAEKGSVTLVCRTLDHPAHRFRHGLGHLDRSAQDRHGCTDVFAAVREEPSWIKTRDVTEAFQVNSGAALPHEANRCPNDLGGSMLATSAPESGVSGTPG